MYAANTIQKMSKPVKYSFDEYQERTKNDKSNKTKHDRRSKREQKRNFEY